MKTDIEKIKRNFIIWFKKTIDLLSVFAKWVASIAVIFYEIISNYFLIKLNESKIKYEYLKLGKEAYNQWKNNKFFSLQDQLNKIKTHEILISDMAEKVKTSVQHLKKLFEFKSEGSLIIVQGKKGQKPEQEHTPKDDNSLKSSQDETPKQEQSQESSKSNISASSDTDDKKKTPPKKTARKKDSLKEPADQDKSE